MSLAFLVSFIGGLLLAVRLMFFGAERRQPRDGALPLRRSEPAIVAFLLMFGIAGYLLTRPGRMEAMWGAGTATLLAVGFAAIVTRIAIAAARIQPAHDPDDPRFTLQGHVGIVSVAIPVGGEGVVRYGPAGAETAVRAREISNGAVAAGEEICIERVDDGVAYVELWDLVEQRL